jgi:hypothetical protein
MNSICCIEATLLPIYSFIFLTISNDGLTFFLLPQMQIDEVREDIAKSAHFTHIVSPQRDTIRLQASSPIVLYPLQHLPESDPRNEASVLV